MTQRLQIPPFPLPGSAAQARGIQDTLRHQLVIRDDFTSIACIAGVDVGYDNARGLAHASVVTMAMPDLTPDEQIQTLAPVDFPYIPGLLAFREIPAILAALSQLKKMPDLLMVDGHGIAHGKRMGIAAHLGLLLNMPSIGAAKSRLIGSYAEPGPHKGDHVPLMHGKEQVGYVLRSKQNVKPLFVSPGHRVSMETALNLTLACLTHYRLPEPTRLADKFSKCSPKSLS